MNTNKNSEQMTKGEEMLRQLFNTAITRLSRLDIDLQYDSTVLNWLLVLEGWQGSPNALRTLDGYWHLYVGSPIENLILDGKLNKGQTVFISKPISPSDNSLQFDIQPSI